MSRMIASETQAERVGERITGGKRGTAFRVYWHVVRPSYLTGFFIKTKGGVSIYEDDAL